jgi:hypothetical protein
VHHAIDALRLKNVAQGVGLPQVDLKKGNIRRHGGPMSESQIVDDGDARSGRAQTAHGVRPDISGSAGDKNIHRSIIAMERG